MKQNPKTKRPQKKTLADVSSHLEEGFRVVEKSKVKSKVCTGVLTFPLPTCEEDFDRAVAAGTLSSFIWDIGKFLRDELKYNNRLKAGERAQLEKVQALYYELSVNLPLGVVY